MKPLISVIVPIYNAAEWLERCLDSIRMQTYKALEVILINDGSTDGSSEICNRYSEMDKRFIVIHKENGGAASARNEGLRRCRGDYIGFVDSDDWIAPSMYEDMAGLVIEKQADLAFCSRYNIFEGKEETKTKVKSRGEHLFTGECSGEKAFSYCLNGYYTGVPNKLYKTELLKDNGKMLFFNEKLKNSEDIVFNVQVIPRAKKVVCTDKKLYYRVIRKSNSLQNDMTLTQDRMMEVDAWEWTIHYAGETKMPEKIVKQLKLGYCNFLLAVEIQAYLQKRKEILSLIRKKLTIDKLRKKFYCSSNISIVTKMGRLFFEILM